jgi:hypothetical protein
MVLCVVRELKDILWEKAEWIGCWRGIINRIKEIKDPRFRR